MSENGKIGSIDLNRVGECVWEIPQRGRMLVPGRIYASDELARSLRDDKTLDQVVNVAQLPGIVKYSVAMPDAHWGYGFCIGGVAATYVGGGGVVSPGGVGYDINCGCRLMTTALDADEVRSKTDQIAHGIYSAVPCGVGSSGGTEKLSARELKDVMLKGAAWAVERRYGTPEDLERTEDQGCIGGADPEKVTKRAIERGLDQVGTLGSGNHFVEVGVVDQVFDPQAAAAMGLREGGVVVWLHSGSRGFGHQVCDDSLKVMQRAAQKYGIELPDRQLACAPVDSPEGRDYLAAMACAANYAWANRQCMMHLIREALMRVLSMSARALDARLVYDVCHNIAKIEDHAVGDATMRLCVHRKGATRAFAPGRPEVPAVYREIGQPVLIPGDMGRASYVCVGTEKAMAETFGSTCHGAGRLLSRHAAIGRGRGRSIARELKEKGIVVIARERDTLAEEMPEAYKDVNEVVDSVHRAGISRKVARTRPLAVVKG